MKNNIATILLSLLASLTTIFAEEDLNRRSVIEKSLVDQQPLHQQIQLIIFDAYENTKSSYHPNGIEFYEKYFFDVKKFLVQVCKNKFVGEKALKRIDSITSDNITLKISQSMLERAKKSEDKERINKLEKRIASIEAHKKVRKEFIKLVSTPQKVITNESVIEFLKEEAHVFAERSIYDTFGIVNLKPGEPETKSLTSSFDIQKIKLGFIKYGQERIKFAKFKISGNVNAFLDLYSDMGVDSMLHYPDFRLGRLVDPGDEKVLKIWEESGEDIIKAKKIYHNSKIKK